jgi:formylglycine-generating enzyme required for sulfatase activity
MEARAFCEWLSLKESRTYRLPSDAEWSAAAGLGKYPWGNTWPPSATAGNYAGEESAQGMPDTWRTIPGFADGYPRTSPVTAFAENALGLYNMGGNVWEWCEDAYHPTMNSAEALQESSELMAETAPGGIHFRVVRGACWIDFAEIRQRTSYRWPLYPAARTDGVGFRCVVVVPGN